MTLRRVSIMPFRIARLLASGVGRFMVETLQGRGNASPAEPDLRLRRFGWSAIPALWRRLGGRTAAAVRGRALGWPLALLPALLLLALVFVLPLAFLATTSFHRGAGMGVIRPGWTLANYVKFLGDPFYLGIVLETFLIGAIVVAACVVIGFPVAYFLARTRSRLRGAYTFLVIAPLLVSVVVRNLGWLPLLGDNGLVNWLLLRLGLVAQPIKLVYDTTGVVIGLVHALVPFMILSLTTVIRGIAPEIEEAAINLGAGRLETFRRVVLPLSRAGLLAGCLLVFTAAISAYITPAMMGGRRVLVMSLHIEQQIRSVLNYPFGATAAVVLLAVSTVLAVVALRLAGDRR